MPSGHTHDRSGVEARVLYFTGCPHHPPAVERLRTVAERLGVPLNLHEVEVTPKDEPEVLGFRGSPTVLINGADVDPAARDSGDFGFGCRTYGGSGAPSEAMLEAALKEAGGESIGPGEASDPSTGESGDGVSSGPTSAGGSTLWASFVAVGTAGLASACCWLPLLAVGLGLSLSVSGMIGVFEAARPYLLGVAGVSLAFGFYAVYFRRSRCAPGSACATARPKSGAGAQAMVWGAVVTVAALARFPYYSGVLIGSGAGLASGSEAAANPGGAASNISDVVYEVEGMTCAGCEAAVCAALREVPGVEACRASYEKGRAWILPTAEEPEKAAILEAIERAGFSASLASPNPRHANEP